MKKYISGLMCLLISTVLCAQQGRLEDRDHLIFLTQEWKGERFKDGRPKVSDELLNRLRKIGTEQVWTILRGLGYNNQYAGNFMKLHDDQPFVGRALTAQYMPLRPDLEKRLIENGKKEGRIGPMNSWPIDMLQKGDVYVADCFEKITNGTLIGDNLATSIFTKTGTGVIFDAAARDIDGQASITGFNAYVRGWDPSFLTEAMLVRINGPLIIGEVTVLPGDLVLARREGVVFIPSHLAQEVVINSEFVMLRDEFAIQRLKAGVYTPGQIDTAWTDVIKQDFLNWIKQNPNLLPMSREELDNLMKNRTW
ncbi:MAG: RraA family protein [Cyclobacteriaceae bacterium]